MSELAWLVEFSQEVRESSLKRLRQVEHEDYGWQSSPHSARFVDILYHLWQSDLWVFRLLDGHAIIENRLTLGETDVGRWDEYYGNLVASGHERAGRIAQYTMTDLTRCTYKMGRWREVNLAYLLLRGHLDHEIHHRGELQAALRLRYHP